MVEGEGERYLYGETAGVDCGRADPPYPFEELGQRIVPFAAVSMLGLAGALLPGPGPSPNWAQVAISVLLFGTMAIMLVLPWQRMPSWATIGPPLVYLGFVMMLMASQGGVGTGSASLVFVPVLWVACYHRRRDSVIVVAAVVIVMTAMSVASHGSVAVTIRRSLLCGVMCAGVSVAVHQLRARMQRSGQERDELLHEARIIDASVEELSCLLDPAAVIVAATRIAGELAYPDSSAGRRAVYIGIEGGQASVMAQFDEAGADVALTWPLADHPPLQRAAETGRAVRVCFDDEAMAPDLQGAMTAAGITHGACIPIAPGGLVHGVLAVGGRGQPIPANVFHHLVALGHTVELALANALRHQEVIRQASTDELTGLANRRAFFAAGARRTRHHAFAVIAADVDGLKAINDEHGHPAGDAQLVQVGRAMRLVLREADLAARVGGDEFAILLPEADIDVAGRVASRLLDAVAATPFGSVPAPRLSLGIAFGSPLSSLADVHQMADKAMYEAKRRGGMMWLYAPHEVTAPQRRA